MLRSTGRVPCAFTIGEAAAIGALLLNARVVDCLRRGQLLWVPWALNGMSKRLRQLIKLVLRELLYPRAQILLHASLRG